MHISLSPWPWVLRSFVKFLTWRFTGRGSSVRETILFPAPCSGCCCSLFLEAFMVDMTRAFSHLPLVRFFLLPSVSSDPYSCSKWELVLLSVDPGLDH